MKNYFLSVNDKKITITCNNREVTNISLGNVRLTQFLTHIFNNYAEVLCLRLVRTAPRGDPYSLNYIPGKIEGWNFSTNNLPDFLKQMGILLKKFFEIDESVESFYGNLDECLKDLKPESPTPDQKLEQEYSEVKNEIGALLLQKKEREKNYKSIQECYALLEKGLESYESKDRKYFFKTDPKRNEIIKKIREDRRKVLSPDEIAINLISSIMKIKSSHEENNFFAQLGITKSRLAKTLELALNEMQHYISADILGAYHAIDSICATLRKCQREKPYLPHQIVTGIYGRDPIDSLIDQLTEKKSEEEVVNIFTNWVDKHAHSRLTEKQILSLKQFEKYLQNAPVPKMN